jgi:hypothetical protein
MSTRIAKWLAWSLFTLAVALGLGFLLLFVAATSTASATGRPLPTQTVATMDVYVLDWIAEPLVLLAMWTLSALGALIVSRYPTHAIGWIFCAGGLLLVADQFAGYYAIYALFDARGALPGGLAAGWFQSWSWAILIALLGAFVPLLFPNGRLVSRRWRPAWWMATGATLTVSLGSAFAPGPLDNLLIGLGVPNPLGVAGLGGLNSVLDTATYSLLLASMLLAAASLVVRLRRARGVERQQIKWFAYVGVAFALFFVLRGVVRDVLGLPIPALVLGLDVGYYSAGIGLPLVAGLSILRYRLFDIDVIIRLTLIYGTLTATLAGVYVGIVIAAQIVIRPLTGQAGEQPPVIVASTLLVVALSAPLRRSVQAAIDRRFYRPKVDAEQTLAAFSATLRSEVDLNRLREGVLAVVEETMQPAHAWLWLRPTEQQHPAPWTITTRALDESALTPPTPHAGRALDALGKEVIR